MDTRDEHAGIGDAELRMGLRGLRQDIDPGHDLWPGIAARLHSQPQRPTEEVQTARHAWLWPVATAASLLLAVGVAWQLRPAQPATQAAPIIAQVSGSDSGSDSGATLMQREADSLTTHYQAALREMAPQPVPAGWQQGLDALDRSAVEIRGAMQHDPNSRLLLERLRDTYTRRLALARRALYV